MSSAAAAMLTSECGTERGWHGSRICSADCVYNLSSGSVTQWHSTGLTSVMSTLNSIKLWLLHCCHKFYILYFFAHTNSTPFLKKSTGTAAKVSQICCPVHQVFLVLIGRLPQNAFQCVEIVVLPRKQDLWKLHTMLAIQVESSWTKLGLCWDLTLNCSVWAFKWCKKCRNKTLFLADTAT